MRAVTQLTPGGPEVLQDADLPDPVPGHATCWSRSARSRSTRWTRRSAGGRCGAVIHGCSAGTRSEWCVRSRRAGRLVRARGQGLVRGRGHPPGVRQRAARGGRADRGGGPDQPGRRRRRRSAAHLDHGLGAAVRSAGCAAHRGESRAGADRPGPTRDTARRRCGGWRRLDPGPARAAADGPDRDRHGIATGDRRLGARSRCPSRGRPHRLTTRSCRSGSRGAGSAMPIGPSVATRSSNPKESCSDVCCTRYRHRRAHPPAGAPARHLAARPSDAGATGPEGGCRLDRCERDDARLRRGRGWWRRRRRRRQLADRPRFRHRRHHRRKRRPRRRRGRDRPGRSVHPHLLHDHGLRGLRRGRRAAEPPHPW